MGKKIKETIRDISALLGIAESAWPGSTQWAFALIMGLITSGSFWYLLKLSLIWAPFVIVPGLLAFTLVVFVLCKWNESRHQPEGICIEIDKRHQPDAAHVIRGFRCGFECIGPDNSILYIKGKLATINKIQDALVEKNISYSKQPLPEMVRVRIRKAVGYDCAGTRHNFDAGTEQIIDRARAERWESAEYCDILETLAL